MFATLPNLVSSANLINVSALYITWSVVLKYYWNIKSLHLTQSLQISQGAVPSNHLFLGEVCVWLVYMTLWTCIRLLNRNCWRQLMLSLLWKLGLQTSQRCEINCEWGHRTIEHVSFLWEASSKSEFKAVTNILHVIGEEIKTTVGKEDSLQTNLIVLLRSRNSERSSKDVQGQHFVVL